MAKYLGKNKANFNILLNKDNSIQYYLSETIRRNSSGEIISTMMNYSMLDKPLTKNFNRGWIKIPKGSGVPVSIGVPTLNSSGKPVTYQ